MIDLYTWSTPNGRKVSIMLEEIELPYTVHPIDIGNDAQFDDDFLEISPNNKIPAIVDRDTGLTLMESGAILLYLAEKSGRLMPPKNATNPANPANPATETARWRVVEWLMFQMGGLGPMLGQAHHFLKFNKGASDYAEKRYLIEARRLYDVMDQRLEAHEFLAGEYSIADIAAWPWVSRFEWQQIDLDEFPAVKRWYAAIAARPAVQRGYCVPAAKAGAGIPLPG